jgi:hypothetical protein
VEFGKNTRFPDTARDELGILGAVIEDENQFVMDHRGGSEFEIAPIY